MMTQISFVFSMSSLIKVTKRRSAFSSNELMLSKTSFDCVPKDGICCAMEATKYDAKRCGSRSNSSSASQQFFQSLPSSWIKSMSKDVLPYPAGADRSVSFLSKASYINSSKRLRVSNCGRRLGGIILDLLTGIGDISV